MSVLDPVRHARLLDVQDAVCEQANIPKAFLNESGKKYLTPDEIAWVVGYPTTGSLLYTGYHKPGADTKMMALTAVLLRNFIDARIMPVSTLLDQDSEIPDPEVLMIPNLFVKGHGKGLTTWQCQSLYDTLLRRQSRGRRSVVYVENMTAMSVQYGQLFAQHLTAYTTIAGEPEWQA